MRYIDMAIEASAFTFDRVTEMPSPEPGEDSTVLRAFTRDVTVLVGSEDKAESMLDDLLKASISHAPPCFQLSGKQEKDRQKPRCFVEHAERSVEGRAAEGRPF